MQLFLKYKNEKGEDDFNAVFPIKIGAADDAETIAGGGRVAYNWKAVFDLYLREYSKQLEREDGAPPPDGLPDSEDDDGELSYHVELLDLIGMCAKGSNKETEEFAESFFSPTDLLTVLSERPAEELWTVDGGHKHPGLANELHAAAEKIDLDDEQDLGEEQEGRFLPCLMRSPALRLMHGIFFSISTSGDTAAVASADAGDASEAALQSAPIFEQWDQLIHCFEGLVQDVRAFCDLVKLSNDEEEEDEESEAGSDYFDESSDDGGSEAASSMAGRRTSRYDASIDPTRRWRTDSSAQEEIWTTLEDHVFYVVLPFVVDFLKCKKDLRRATDVAADVAADETAASQEDQRALEVESDAQVQAQVLQEDLEGGDAVAEALTRALSRGDASTDEGEDTSLGGPLHRSGRRESSSGSLGEEETEGATAESEDATGGEPGTTATEDIEMTQAGKVFGHRDLVKVLCDLCKEIIELTTVCGDQLMETEQFRNAAAACLAEFVKRPIAPVTTGGDAAGEKKLLEGVKVEVEVEGEEEDETVEADLLVTARDRLTKLRAMDSADVLKKTEKGVLPLKEGARELDEMLEGEDDSGARKKIIKKEYVTRYAFEPFKEALSRFMWEKLELVCIVDHVEDKEKGLGPAGGLPLGAIVMYASDAPGAEEKGRMRVDARSSVQVVGEPTPRTGGDDLASRAVRASSAGSSAPQRGGSRPALKLVVQDYKGKDNQVIQFEFDTGQELEEWAEAIVAAISRLSVIGLTQTDLTAEM